MAKKGLFNCLDCGVNTKKIGHYYMLNHDTWYSIVENGEGMLCFPCLEGRLGRPLVANDFTDIPINHMRGWFDKFATV